MFSHRRFRVGGTRPADRTGGDPMVFAMALSLALETPLPRQWEYADAMRAVASRSHARPGVVLHVGDSITYSSPYGQWARYGQGRTAGDRAALAWMHAGADDDS